MGQVIHVQYVRILQPRKIYLISKRMCQVETCFGVYLNSSTEQLTYLPHVRRTTSIYYQANNKLHWRKIHKSS